MKNLLNNLFESNFEDIFHPGTLEDALKAKWLDSQIDSFEQDDKDFITFHLGLEDYVYISTEGIFKQEDLKSFFDSNAAKYITSQKAGSDKMDVYRVNGINVLLLWRHGEIIELMVSPEGKEVFAKAYLRWKKNKKK